MPELHQPSEALLSLIADKVRTNKEFRILIGGSSLVPSKEHELLYWKTYSSDNTKRVLVAEHEGNFHGFFALDEIDQGHGHARAHISFWSQTKAFSELCAIFLTYCRVELGLNTLWSMINSTNEKVQNFSNKIGFREVGRIPRFYTMENEKGDAIIQQLILKGIR